MIPVSMMFPTPFPGCIEFFQIARDLATVFTMARVVVIYIGFRLFYALTAVVFIASARIAAKYAPQAPVWLVYGLWDEITGRYL
jgi:hypothetical protein